MEQVLYKLPNGWKWQELADVVVKTENLNPLKHANQLWTYIDISSVDRDRFTVTDPQKILGEDAPSRAKRHVQLNDVIFATTRPNLKNIALIRNEYSSPVASTGFCVLRANENVLPAYLFYFVTTDFVQAQIEPYVGGASYPAITDGNLKKTPIPIPSIEEQKLIVEKLDALLPRINASIEHLQESITLANSLSKSGLLEIFKGLKDNHEVVPLSSVVKINSGIALPKLFKNGFTDGDIPFFKVAQMNNHHENMVDPEITFNKTVAKKYKVRLFPKGSTLIPKRGGAILTNKKRMLLEDASYDSNIMGLKADESKISDHYLFAFMRTIDLANFVDASTIPQVNNKHIDQMQIPLASIEEQADVVNQVNLLVKKVKAMNFEIQRQLNDLQSLKNSILDSAFKGAL
ncbi:restriction endonuclease subunit S [Providencia rettgeri]|nr:restriction endonuclease subunit S [Providencia rettgeri]